MINNKVPNKTMKEQKCTNEPNNTGSLDRKQCREHRPTDPDKIEHKTQVFTMRAGQPINKKGSNTNTHRYAREAGNNQNRAT